MSSVAVRIGVATTVMPRVRQTKNGTVNRPAMQYVRMAEEAFRRGASLYLFHPHKVDWSRGQVQAYVPEKPNLPRLNWIARNMPLPEVIYENVFVHLAIKGYASTLRTQAQRRNIPLFNPVLPGKWRMVEILNQTGMNQLTPETERLRDAEQVRQKLIRWGVAYVKPIGGYGGMDVNRIERLPGGRYRIAVDRTKSQTGRMRSVMTQAELRGWVARKHRRPHLLQRGLQLMSINGRKVDFRVVVHRDVHGEWKLVGIVPKVAADDGVVTNIIAGGERSDIVALVQQALREGKKIPVDILENEAKRIASELSKRYRNVGLIGFDMAVEENGQVAMIEMNPKPARSLLTRPMLERLAEHTVGFAVYLAGRRR